MMPDGCMTGRQARGIAGYSLFARKLSTFEAIDTKTAAVLVKTESRLFCRQQSQRMAAASERGSGAGSQFPKLRLDMKAVPLPWFPV
ncbi:hypothetical protein DEA98_25725 [Brucella pseudogrignonensis]|nr:hypothetical protein [Brucella pseudogrignonensis]